MTCLSAISTPGMGGQGLFPASYGRPVRRQEEQQQGSSGQTAGEPAPHQVFLFEEPDFGGQSLGFTYDNDVPNLTRWNLPSGEKWNDRISSLKAGKDTRITLYQNSNYGGASVSFEGDGTNGAEVPDLHVTGWGNAVSSLKVRKSYIPKANEVFSSNTRTTTGRACSCIKAGISPISGHGPSREAKAGTTGSAP